ncbi:phosphatase PAP2 family protein [Streptomyces sp. NPDC052701]|uniref:phosphatase PAP2 family protein n=1 Tax=Streptomyces sp. NPDC052701 TaxID=3155533 RepID=UPI00343DC24D
MSTASGRPAALVPLLGIPSLLFALTTWQVVAGGPLLRADARVSRALLHPDRLSGVLSDLGNVPVAIPVLTAALVYAARRARATGVDRWWLPSVAAALVTALVPALVVPLKELTDRPGTPAVPPGTGYYPSGHTVTAAVAYGAAALVLLPWLRGALARRALVAAWVVVSLGTGFGLVRHGYHWPLDVVAGWCLSAVLLTLFARAVGPSGRRTSAGTPGPGPVPADPPASPGGGRAPGGHGAGPGTPSG